MGAPEFLDALKSKYELHEWFLALVPPGGRGGGTDLGRIPPELRRQLELLGVPPNLPPDQILSWIWSRYDFAAGVHELVLKRLPEEMRARLTPSVSFAVGARPSGDLNGSAHPVPVPFGGPGWVIVLDAGLLNLPAFLARSLVWHVPVKWKRRLVASSFAAAGIRLPIWLKFLRWLNLSTKEGVHQRPPPEQVVAEFWFSIEKYATLGVCEGPTSLPGGAILPTYADRGGLGHPLELAQWLGAFAIQFAHLHELGHVVLNHNEAGAKQEGGIARSIEDELKADEFAFQQIIGSARDAESVEVQIAAAALLFATIGIVDERRQHPVSESHPTAEARIKALHAVVDQAMRRRGWDPVPSRQAAVQVAARAQFTWDESARLGIRGSPEGTLFDQHLERCAREGTPDAFKDQVPRWFLIGAPERLCAVVGRAKARVEKALANHPDRSLPEAQRLLSEQEMIEWVMTAAKRAPSIHAFLTQKYEESKKGDLAVANDILPKLTVENLSKPMELAFGAGVVNRDSIAALRAELVGPSSPIAPESGRNLTEVRGEKGYFISVSGLLAKVATTIGVVAKGPVDLAGWFTLISTVASISDMAVDLSREEAQLCALLKSKGIEAESKRRLPKAELRVQLNEALHPESVPEARFEKALETLMKLGIIKREYSGKDELVVLSDIVYVRAALT